ncbi:hypothetical protein CA54_53480 [Symmachiella macrocystis]|uniref:Uncharacterized protein n=1 Tax=Symmachiella macrocystis TaxID=2527985 RepID=A0A5C6B8V2_9PLAN|nr:hypothetical protein CA54_53480 [Symmachiella macrocystis]
MNLKSRIKSLERLGRSRSEQRLQDAYKPIRASGVPRAVVMARFVIRICNYLEQVPPDSHSHARLSTMLVEARARLKYEIEELAGNVSPWPELSDPRPFYDGDDS